MDTSGRSADDTQALGRRELNRRRIRAAIREAAEALFVDRGFDGVSVAEIARRAGVTEKTVFNHFPTKEDLVYAEMEDWEERMVTAVRGRRPDQTVLEAFGAFVVDPSGLLDGPRADRERLRNRVRLVLDTPALLAREARTIERYTDVLAEVLLEEPDIDDPVQAWIAANAMMGVHRAVLAHVRHGVVAERSTKRLVGDVRRVVSRGCAQLASGLGTQGSRR